MESISAVSQPTLTPPRTEAPPSGRPPAEWPPSEWHIPALDGIRALAILLVVPHNVDMANAPYPAYLYPIATVLHAGWIGVQLFFVLSGFLITGKLLDSRGADNYFRGFFGKRVLRIFPLYYAVLCIAFVIAPRFLTMPEQLHASESHEIWLWLFVANWTEPFTGVVYGFAHFWSLCVEEQFYLLWPLVVLLCGPRTLVKVCVATAVVALVVRCALVAAHFPHEALYLFTVCRMDALTLGAAAAALIRIPEAAAALRRLAPRLTWVTVALLVATAAGTRAFAMYDVSTQTIGYTLLSLTFMLVMLLTVVPTTGATGWTMRVLSTTPLRLIGRYSYGMYVLHYPIHMFLGVPLLGRLAPQPTPWESLAYAAVITLVSFLLAALSYEFFERHMLKLKTRFTPSWRAYTPGPA